MNSEKTLDLTDPLVQHQFKFCVHFNGTMSKTCKAGVLYDSVMVENQPLPEPMPCHREGPDTCSQREFLTEEEAITQAYESKRAISRAIAGLTAVSQQVGKQRGISGVMKCPSCEHGVIHYSVSGYNGHIRGKCSTSGCFWWMQ